MFFQKNLKVIVTCSCVAYNKKITLQSLSGLGLTNQKRNTTMAKGLS
jgi:hypothetical protein